MENYLLYPNGDLIVYKDHVKAGHELIEFDRKKGRFFQLSYSKYRLLSSAAFELIKSAKNKVIFLTFTFTKPISQVVEGIVLSFFFKYFFSFRYIYLSISLLQPFV